MAPRRHAIRRRPSRGPLLGLAVAIVVVIVIVIVVLASSGTNKKGGAPPAVTDHLPGTTAPQPSSSATPTAAAPLITLTGTGPGTPTFTAAGGLTVVTARYGGTDNFSVQILDSSGQSVDLPINTIGAYSGTVGEGLNAGSYRLNVNASTDWTITIMQPRNQQAFHLPYAFNNGAGDALIGPFRATGTYQIAATNHGQANFVVSVLDTTGHEQAMPIDQVGDYSDTVTVSRVTPGIYYLQVDSDGAWTVSVSSG